MTTQEIQNLKKTMLQSNTIEFTKEQKINLILALQDKVEMYNERLDEDEKYLTNLLSCGTIQDVIWSVLFDCKFATVYNADDKKQVEAHKTSVQLFEKVVYYLIDKKVLVPTKNRKSFYVTDKILNWRKK